MNPSSHIGILGGGVSGLYFAWLCREKNIPFTLLEAAGRLGGALETSRSENGPVEMGAHTLYNTYALCLDWIERLGLGNKILEKPDLPFRVKSGNEYRSLFKALHWREAASHLIFSRRSKNTEISIREKFSALFGMRNYRDLIGPFFNALLNQDAEAFPSDWVFKKRKKNRRYPRRFTLEGGLSTWVETVESRLKDSIVLNASPETLMLKEGRYFAQTPSRLFEFSHLVLATPLEQTAAYLKLLLPSPVSVPDGLATVQTLSVTVDAARSSLLPPLAGAIATEAPFRSFVTHDDPSHLKGLRGCTFHFKNPHEPSIIEKIQEALLLTERDAIFVRRTKINTMPKITVQNRKPIEALLRETEKIRTLFLCGNAYGGVGIEDCLLRSKQEFERFCQHP